MVFKCRTMAVALVIVLALMTGIGQAAPSGLEVVELTLEQCLELAAENNPQLQLAAVALDQAKLGLKETKSEVRKLKDAEKVKSETNGGSPINGDDPFAPVMEMIMGMLTMAPPSDLETTFYKDHGVWMAEEQVALAQAGYDLAGEGVRLAVINAYYDLLQGEADLVTALAAEKEALEARRAVVAQFKVGMATPAQDLAAEAGRAGARAARLGAESVRETKRLALLREIGLSSDTRLVLSPPVEQQAGFELEQVVQSALESSLEIRGAQFQFDAAEKKFDLTGKWYPDITYKYKGSECEYLEAQIKLADTKIAVESGVRSSYNMYLAAKEQLLPAQRGVEQARHDLNASRAKLEVGAATELDLLSAKRALAQAESTLMGVKKNYAMATASLQAAAKGLTAGLTGATALGGGATSDVRSQR
ncbi:MAG TPA: TolC family protein [bacterium]|nr:TolC family protein [bacterium]